jgi:hypothetical protein
MQLLCLIEILSMLNHSSPGIEDCLEIFVEHVRPLRQEAAAQSVFGLPALKNVILEFKLIMHLWEID